MTHKPMLSETKTNVFISYSWDSPEHSQWVKWLADQINAAGGNSIIDQELRYGGNLRIFLEISIKSSDVVLMILTPAYKQKAETYQGGVFYEYNIITKELVKVMDKNEKYIGVLRSGTHDESVPCFIDDFKYVNLTNGPNFDNNLTTLISQILNVPLKHPEKASKDKPMETHYEQLPQMIGGMNSKAYGYFKEFFVGESKALTKAKIANTLSQWENEVSDYSQEVIAKFKPEKMELYEDYPEDFKNNVLKRTLWTVRAATSTRDPDLAMYKANFRDADEEEIYVTVNGIMSATHEYVREIATTLDYFTVKNEEELKMEYLEEEEMSMKFIIGFGIRSELLHRYYPHHFPVMTQQNLWAMYFICENANEFIKIEQKVRAGQMRVSHNWQYPYERFTFLMNELANQFHSWIGEYGLGWKEEYRFGYINMFLSYIHDHHKPDIKLLHQWA